MKKLNGEKAKEIGKTLGTNFKKVSIEEFTYINKHD
ncbi:MAG: hypothetical protein ACJASF_001654 [Vicingaceae bacterium]|jgi:hypothetical protein